MNKSVAAEKIIIVGVDGFDPSLARKFLDQGKMPNLKKFIEKGSCRKDLSMLGAMPTVTPPMWTTLATGAYPATHGITGFFNQHPTKLDTCIYALDSNMCKAEQLWNVFAEAGKKTLVWHWPGSSWPPTSDSPNLHVVDGTQPNTLGFGTAMIDWDKICLADESITKLQFAAHDASDKGVAGCVITDLEDVIAEDTPKNKLSGADARKIIGGAKKEITVLAMDESDTEVNLLMGSNSDIINSPIKKASGWANAPADAKEFTLLTSAGFVRRPCLILKNEDGIYDHIAIFKSKKDVQPIFTLRKNVYEKNFIDDINKDGNPKPASRCARILELAEDGSRIRLWLGHATDLTNDQVWHPKKLHHEITEKFGAVPLAAQCTGKIHENVEKLLLPSWDIYTQWQADCLTYLMDNNRYDVIFSHVHNVDALGHKFWHFAKYRECWNNDPGFYQKAIEYVYEQTDRYIGRFLKYVDEGWTVFIVSDHGLMCEENETPILAEGAVNIPVMKELGYTVLKKDADGNELREIDWSKTRAVAIRGGQIYLNIKGRDPEGIVDPADKYNLEAEIITDLYRFRDHITGKRVVAVALRNKDAIIIGEGGPECGDIVFFMEEGYNVIHMDSLSTQSGYFDTSVSPIFVAAGPGIKQKYVTDRVIRQVDVAPTLAVLGGVRMPKQCEGAPIYQILD